MYIARIEKGREKLYWEEPLVVFILQQRNPRQDDKLPF